MTQRVYTTTRLGAVLLYAMVLSLVLIAVGLVAGIDGVTAGGLALLGAVFTCSMIVGKN